MAPSLKGKRPAGIETYVSTKKGEEFLVWKKDKKSFSVTYFFRGLQGPLVDKMIFKGFLELPKGLFLSKEGWGFNAASKGYYFLKVLKESIPAKKKLEIIIKRSGKSGVKKTATKVVVTLLLDDLKHLIGKFKLVNSRTLSEVKDTAGAFLKEKLGAGIRLPERTYDKYEGGELKEILNRKGILDALTEDDIEAFVAFYPKIFKSSVKGRKRALSQLKIRLAQEGKKVTDKVYLDEVIKEFEEKLSKHPSSETVWQIFLKDKVLPFLNNTQIIDRQKITLDGKAPDFVLVDVYGFADVIEIKTPSMKLMTADSRKNYHWSTDMSVAIAQAENYLDDIKDNQSEYVKLVKRKYNIDLTLTRPRGFVIAGALTEFENRKQKEDYRRLRCSHKNIEFTTYDELLANLKHIQSKLDR